MLLSAVRKIQSAHREEVHELLIERCLLPTSNHLGWLMRTVAVRFHSYIAKRLYASHGDESESHFRPAWVLVSGKVTFRVGQLVLLWHAELHGTAARAVAKTEVESDDTISGDDDRPRFGEEAFEW